MNATKEDVRNFINKVRAKAVLSVMDKNNAIIKETLEAELNKPENAPLKLALLRTQKYLEKFVVERKALADLLEPLGLKKRSWEVRDLFDYYGDDVAIDFQKELFKTYCPSIESIQEVVSAKENAINETKEAYAKVLSLVEKAHNGVKGVTILKELGFDTSTLETKTPEPNISEILDTAKLFPCGDNK